MPIYIALFRNLNLGHRGSPNRDQLLAAFDGVEMARSFQTNGTVLLRTPAPDLAVQSALERLQEVGYRDSVVIRTIDEIRDAVAATREADPAENVYRTTLSFFDAEQPPALALPYRSSNQLVEIRCFDDRSAASVCWQRGSTIGDVNALLERLLEIPVTTRTLGTMQRLLATAERT